jgi:hypothetical protein
MYFDANCGPCTLFAHLTAGLSRSHLDLYPLDGPEADRALGSMSPETRYGAFHIVEPGNTWTGPDAMPPGSGWSVGAAPGGSPRGRDRSIGSFESAISVSGSIVDRGDVPPTAPWGPSPPTRAGDGPGGLTRPGRAPTTGA